MCMIHGQYAHQIKDNWMQIPLDTEKLPLWWFIRNIDMVLNLDNNIDESSWQVNK